MPKFEVLSEPDKKGNPPKGDAIFYAVDQAAISLLESLTPQEKAHLVPYLRIWRVDPTTGKPRWAGEDDSKPLSPLTLDLTSPPPFGQPVALAERPPASLERFTLQQQQVKGRITVFKLLIRVVIHRPDALPLRLPEGRDSVGSLLHPGMVHAAEFGWSSSTHVKNDLFNGNGLPNKDSRSIVPGRRTIYFQVVSYKFKLQQDGQIYVDIVAMESGLLNLRKWAIGEKKEDVVRIELPDPATLPPRRGLKDYYASEAGKALKERLQKELDAVIRQHASGGRLKLMHFLNFMSDTISDCFSESGYKKVFLRVGLFNSRCGFPSERYGPNEDMKDRSIGDFELPVKEVSQRFANLMKYGQEITVQNVLVPFLQLLSTGAAWSSKSRAKSKVKDPLTGQNLTLQSTPDIFGKVITNGDSIAFFILDAKREYTKISADDYITSDFSPTIPRSQLKEELSKRQVPYVAFGHANSYIKDATFDVNLDPLTQAHLIYQAHKGNLRPDAAEKAGENQPASATKVDAVDPGTLLFRSAIQGDILMLGNFAFDMFATIWLDFGVPQWSGPFALRSLEYSISRGEFTTKVSLIATGADPARAAQRAAKKAQVVG